VRTRSASIRSELRLAESHPI